MTTMSLRNDLNHQPIAVLDVEQCIPQIKHYLLNLQSNISNFVRQIDPACRYTEDVWAHGEGGGGNSQVFDQGSVFEKAGVNFSHVHGRRLPAAATVKRPEIADASFQALGVSVVMHPLNPYVPTSHFNVRAIIVERNAKENFWWFGGGFDLTPYYGFIEDCVHWHQMAKKACDPFGEHIYPQYKKWADDYFYLKHRQEPRGIGGIFFDDLNAFGYDSSFAFMQSVGEHYLKAYQPIVLSRKDQDYAERERAFQLYRRGRYVEFNLLYDRGTLFGLQSGGRTESILMSLPPLVAWAYNWQVEPDSPEANLYEQFLKPRSWV